jgi:hypothetical protein
MVHCMALLADMLIQQCDSNLLGYITVVHEIYTVTGIALCWARIIRPTCATIWMIGGAILANHCASMLF